MQQAVILRKAILHLLLISLIFSLQAHAETSIVSMDESAWYVLHPWGDSASMSSSSQGMVFSNTGYREGMQSLTRECFDMRNATIYIKWKANGPRGRYMGCGVGVGWPYINSRSTTGIYCPASAGWTTPSHGSWFSTDHSWEGSLVVEDNTWYFTRISISADRTARAVTSTGNYDDQGGTVFYSFSFDVSEEDWSRLSCAGISATFVDNYGGTQSSVTIGEARIVPKNDALLLSDNTSGTLVDLAWTDVPGIQRYVLYYALPDQSGEIDISTVGSIDMGPSTSISAELPSGLTFFAAAVGYDGSGNAHISNIEPVVSFGGTINIPDTGARIMEITDPDGIGSISINGTSGANGPEFPVTSMIINPKGSTPFTLFFDEEDRLARYVSADEEVSFTPAGNGGFSYVIKKDGNVWFSGAVEEQPATRASVSFKSSGSSGGASSAVLPIPVDCSVSKDEFLYRVEQTDVIRKFKEDIAKSLRIILLMDFLVEKIVKMGLGHDFGPDITEIFPQLNGPDKDAALDSIGEKLRQGLEEEQINIRYATWMIAGIREAAAEAYDRDCSNQSQPSQGDGNNTQQHGPPALPEIPEPPVDMSGCGDCPVPYGAEFARAYNREYYALNGKVVGPYYKWTDDSKTKPSWCGCYDENGQLHGLTYQWSDGTVHATTRHEYEHGIIQSTMHWYSSGNIKYQAFHDYSDGEVVEIYQYWDITPANGAPPAIRSLETMKNRKLEGWQYFWYQNGTLMNSYYCEDGMNHGEYYSYRQDGSIEVYGHYKKGKEDGEWRRYRDDGSLYSLEYYENDELVRRIQYRSDGSVYSDCTYSNGQGNCEYK